MRVALTGLFCIPFTPRTPFETCCLGSKARPKIAPQAWAGPTAAEITVSWQRQLLSFGFINRRVDFVIIKFLL